MVSASTRDRLFEEVGSSSPPSSSLEAIGPGLSGAVSTGTQSDSETTLPPDLKQKLSRTLTWATCPNVDSSSVHVKATRPNKKACLHSSSISPNGTKSRSKSSRTTTAATPTTTGFCRAKVTSPPVRVLANALCESEQRSYEIVPLRGSRCVVLPRSIPRRLLLFRRSLPPAVASPSHCAPTLASSPPAPDPAPPLSCGPSPPAPQRPRWLKPRLVATCATADRVCLELGLERRSVLFRRRFVSGGGHANATFVRKRPEAGAISGRQ